MTNEVLNLMAEYDLYHVIYTEKNNEVIFECFSSDDYYFTQLLIKETGINARTILY